MLTPIDVFTPGKLPLSSTNVYATRTKDGVQKKFEKALDRGLVPILFGEYGVGKTSMARHVAKGADLAGKLVNVESVAEKTIADVFEQCLEKIGYSIQRKRTSSRTSAQSVETSAQAKAGIGWLEALVASKRTKTGGTGDSVEEELVVTSPTNSKMFEICEREKLVLLLDEVHKCTPRFAQELADFLKAYGNANCRAFKIILLGTASEASKLVSIDPGIDRLIQEIHLGALDEEEGRYVVDEGMKSLQITVERNKALKLVRMCVGSPNILQYLCLEAAESAWERKPREIVGQDIDDAITAYVDSRERRLYRTYMAAIETVGEKRYRKQILRAMAESEDEYVTMEQIRTSVSRYLKEEVPSNSLSGQLRALKTAKLGPVLRDVERPDAEGRLSNYTIFQDPSLKAFIRLMNLREAEEL